MIKIKQIHYLICIFLFQNINTQINIISPYNLSKKINDEFKSTIPYKLGNFGKIPYGKKLLGYIIISKQKDGTNYWCDYNKTENQIKINEDLDEYLPFVLVEHSTNCKYAMKAYNIQKRGGKGMLLIYDSNQIDEDNIYNIDDVIGKKVTIPSMIISKDFGNIIKKYIEENKNDTVIISMKFSGDLNNGKIKLELYYNSDDYKSYNFFKEFEFYKNKLSNILIFTPRLKYNVMKGEITSNELNSKSKIPCIKQKPFCVNSVNKLKLDNPREILLENLRQSCIFEKYDLNKYWSYMINFSNKCSNYEKLNFNEECSKEIIKQLNLNYKEIQTCMEDLIKSEGKIEDDYNEYNKRKIISIPQLTINNIYYREMWSAKNIFKRICNGFLNNKKLCSSLSPEDVKYHFNFGINMIILITFGIALLLFCTILCYRRMVTRAFEETLDDKIKEQALISIRQYENFKVRNSSHKLELINE